MFKNIVLIHGVGGLGKEPFFPHLKTFCENLGLKVFMPKLGSYHDGITYGTWKRYFDENLKPVLNNETIVVAQSMGTQFAVKYLVENNLSVGLYISCAGPKQVLVQREDAPERGKLNINPVAKYFVPSDAEFEIFKNLDFKKYSFFSDNDIWFEQQNLENYAEAIGAVKMFTRGKSHYNNDEIFVELEALIGKCIENVTKVDWVQKSNLMLL